MAPLLFDDISKEEAFQEEEEEIVFDFGSEISYTSFYEDDDDEDFDYETSPVKQAASDTSCSQEHRILVAEDAAAMGRLTRLKEHIVDSVAVGNKDTDNGWSGIKAANQLDLRSIHIRVSLEAAAIGRVSRGSERRYTTANYDLNDEDANHRPTSSVGANGTEAAMISKALSTIEEAEYQVDDIILEMAALGEVDSFTIDETISVIVKLQKEIESLSHYLKYQPNNVSSLIDGVIKKQRADISRSWAHHLTVLEDLEAYQNTKDTFDGQNLAVLPCLEEPKFVKPVHYMTKKNQRDALAIQAAKMGMEKTILLSNTDTIRIRSTCSCPYCGNPSAFQTQSYKKMRLRKKDNDTSLKTELVGLARKMPSKRITFRQNQTNECTPLGEGRAARKLPGRTEPMEQSPSESFVSPRTKRKLDKEASKNKAKQLSPLQRFVAWISPSKANSAGNSVRVGNSSLPPSPPPLEETAPKGLSNVVAPSPKVKCERVLMISKEKSDKKSDKFKESNSVGELYEPDPSMEGKRKKRRKGKSTKKDVLETSIHWERKPDPPFQKNESPCAKKEKRNGKGRKSTRKMASEEKQSEKDPRKSTQPTRKDESSKVLKREKSSRKLKSSTNLAEPLDQRETKKKGKEGRRRPNPPSEQLSKSNSVMTLEPIEADSKPKSRRTCLKKAKSDRVLGNSTSTNKRTKTKRRASLLLTCVESESESDNKDNVRASKQSPTVLQEPSTLHETQSNTGVWVSPRSKRRGEVTPAAPSPYALQKARLSKVATVREVRPALHRSQSEVAIGTGPSLRSILISSSSNHKANSDKRRVAPIPPLTDDDVPMTAEEELQAKLKRQRRASRRALIDSCISEALSFVDDGSPNPPKSKQVANLSFGATMSPAQAKRSLSVSTCESTAVSSTCSSALSFATDDFPLPGLSNLRFESLECEL